MQNENMNTLDNRIMGPTVLDLSKDLEYAYVMFTTGAVISGL